MPEKLVRDKIVEIIQGKGETATSRQVSGDAEFEQFLRIKLGEEMAEFLESLSIEEAADIIEVLSVFGKLKGFTLEQILEVKEKKRLERGGFDKGIILQME